MTNTLTQVYYDDTLSLVAEDFRSLRAAVAATARVVRPLYAGIRYDEIRYFDPDAHANIPEMGLLQSGDANDSTATTIRYLYGEGARWELEAVNAHILTPFVSMEVAKTLRIRAAYSCGFYDTPVRRQGRTSGFHGNFSIGATVNYRIARLPE
jgi:hypothetical protein